jgi:glycosyltransferase involved in cell wall biosynthesis
MPPITAIVHTCNDGLRLGRTLETLRPCDQILVLDHGSMDQTLRVARDYGAAVYAMSSDRPMPEALHAARHPWLLFIAPSEAISEGLEASLLEWKLRTEGDVARITACSVLLREETGEGWSEPRPYTRLTPRKWSQWDGNFPRYDSRSLLLEGDLLRFR